MENTINKAIEVMNNSYSKYSKFQVGAAIKLKNGEIVLGTNIENKSYSLTMCAERVAMFSMYTKGYNKDDVDFMVVVANTDNIISPCGACREVMNELLNKDTVIVLSNKKGQVRKFKNEELLPFNFELEVK